MDEFEIAPSLVGEFITWIVLRHSPPCRLISCQVHKHTEGTYSCIPNHILHTKRNGWVTFRKQTCTEGGVREHIHGYKMSEKMLGIYRQPSCWFLCVVCTTGRRVPLVVCITFFYSDGTRSVVTGFDRRGGWRNAHFKEMLQCEARFERKITTFVHNIDVWRKGEKFEEWPGQRGRGQICLSHSRAAPPADIWRLF